MGAPSTMGALRIADRPKWASAVKEAMKKAEGRIPIAANLLAVSPRQLFRWLQEDDFKKVTRVPVGSQISTRKSQKAPSSGRKPKKVRKGGSKTERAAKGLLAAAKGITKDIKDIFGRPV